ncbi:metalloregulator ArsR/SmtB family transcription factor [bacterium]|nr:metalloregulator ArsR/SmtB family transcription factor [bacterium]
MKFEHKELFALHADFCRTLGNPKRLMILDCLSKKESSVGEIAETIAVPLTNVSQHLNILRSSNIVRCRKEGQMVYYSLVDDRITLACMTIRAVLLDSMKARGEIASGVETDNLSK